MARTNGGLAVNGNVAKLTIEEDEELGVSSPLLPAGAISLNYNSDSAMYDQQDRNGRWTPL